MTDLGRWRVAGAVLAGGEGRRMGVRKEGVTLPDGRPMIAPLLDAMEEAFGGVVIAGACEGFDCAARPGVSHIHDLHPGLGPLAGLEALLGSGLADGYVVAACDQPLLTAGPLRRLSLGDPGRAHFFRSASGECLDPLPGYFPHTCLGEVRAALAERRLAFRHLARSLGALWTELPDHEAVSLQSVNTPEDLARLAGLWNCGRA